MRRLAAELRSPLAPTGAYSWSLADIVAARNMQMQGQFALPARLAESMRTDDALAVAWENRLAPQRCIAVELVARKGARGAAIAAEAEALFGAEGVGIHPDTLADVHSAIVNHGVAFGINVATPRADGSRVDFELKSWPIEFVRWDPLDRCFKARVDPLGQPAYVPPPIVVQGERQAYRFNGTWEEPIVHGDGRWVVFKKHEVYPWRDEAAILAAALVWARHAFGCRDWAKASKAHGTSKVIGEMPEGVALQGKDGALSPEAAAMKELLDAIAEGDTLSGVRPAGSKVDFLVNSSTAWQVFTELVGNAEKAAARIYLGTDGTLGTNGGAPGVDITQLFGVASTKVEGDLKAIERGILTGTIEPWCATNFGDSSLAPLRRYALPDEDEAERDDQLGRRTAAFWAALKGAKDAGIVVDQAYVNGLAADFRVRAPVLPVPAPASAPAPALRSVG